MSGVIISTVIAAAAAPLVFAKGTRRVFLLAVGGFAATVAMAVVTTMAWGWSITENLTHSLNGSIYIHRAGEPFTKGDLVAYRWRGGATYPAGTTFIKRIVGVPGDTIRTEGRQVWVNDALIGTAKPFSRAGVPLEAVEPGVIPEGRYFVATPMVDSLDSRYKLTGTIANAEIIGRAHEVF